jgi:ATP-dependent helicase/nuclease subunit A
MKPIGHVMILASAGAGKTYQLTNRFVRLLAEGAPPERIAALTFTRKAAGEFFDEILGKLAEAASDPAVAAKVGAQIGHPQLRPADFNRMLRSVIVAMPRLNLGTLDGFFARVVRAFPLELGLSGDFAIMEEHAARMARRRVLRRIFARTGGTPDAAQQDFIEAFKRATFGREEKQLTALLDTFLDDHAETFLESSDPALWGQVAQIWPEGSAWVVGTKDRATLARELERALAAEAMSGGQRLRWDKFFAALPQWAPGAELPGEVKYLLGNALKAWPDLAEVTVERKAQELTAPVAAALRRLVAAIVGGELNRRLEMTRGIYAVLREYEAIYDGLVRRSGNLTFADLQRLLRPDAGGRQLSRTESDDARLFIDWRLDARIDHWLLDEFQDTSPGQWSVLRNLIDEAVQDPEGRRSFFYVGDVKQAIFAWRAGDPRLFREIFNRYNAGAGGVIAEQSLATSYRSGPAVIEMVNRVFGDTAALARLFPEPAVERWATEWREHSSERPTLGGYAELRPVGGEEERFAATLGILEETQALARGLTVAILVLQNRTAAELADYLRRQGGVAATAESDLHVGADNPLSCALLALFRAAAHPGDTAAQLHLRMTPLAEVLAAEGLEGEDALTKRILEEVHAGGFGAASEAWIRRLEPRLAPDDAFSRQRGRQFADAAREFDELGNGEVAEFVQFMSRYTARDADAAGVVRVMTVHKAKGLGFDLVILPDLEGDSLASRRKGQLAVQKSPAREVEWILHLPSSEFFAADPVLSDHVAAAKNDACYENFCLLYVAMTRAKRAMYILTKPVGKSESKNFPRLLEETLGGAWSIGDPAWFQTSAAPPAVPPPPEALLLDSASTRRTVRRAVRRPSDEGGGTTGAARLFTLAGAAESEFGVAVHALLAGVEWADATVAERAAAEWAARGPAGAAAAGALSQAETAAVWRRPDSPGAEAWRERAFEVVLDQSWVTGKFDRVVVTRDAAGRALAATVYDFKTGTLAEGTDLAREALRHKGQLELYCRAAAVLAGLPLEAVAAEIIFTAAGRRVRL